MCAKKKKKRTRIKFIPGCYVRHHQVLLLIGSPQESAPQTTTSPESRPSLFPNRLTKLVCTSVVAMATSNRKYSVPALQLCVCCAVLLCLLTADVSAAPHRQPGVVASTEAFYLRGTPSVNAEVEESYESFVRRELTEYDSSANCSANCDVP